MAIFYRFCGSLTMLLKLSQCLPLSFTLSAVTKFL